MTEHDHTNIEDYHTQGDRSADQDRRSTAGPTDVALLKPESVRECGACGERAASHVLPGGVGICECYPGVRRGAVTDQEKYSRSLSSDVERPIIGQIEEH